MKINAILVGITILLLLVLPASASDFTLGVFGNANEDNTINMQDVTYTELIIAEHMDETELADAKYDGDIDILDMTRIALIILGKEKEMTVLDATDKIVTVKKPIERIITPNGDCMPLMRALGAADKIVGVSKYTIEDTLLYPEFSDYPNIGSVWSPDYEAMLECNPDLVIMYASFSQAKCDAIEDTLTDANPGIACIRVDGYKPSSQVEDTMLLGYLLGKRDEAKVWLGFYEGFLNQIYDEVEDIPMDDRARMYIECWRPYHTAAGNSGWCEKVELAGGYNIFRDLTIDYPDVTKEDVINRHPDAIIRATKTEGGYDTNDMIELSNLADEIMNRSELAYIPAVENGKVYVINNVIFGGTAHFVGMGYIAKWLYPDRFTDLDPEAAHRQYLTEFQGLDESLVDDGVFVYPPLEEN
ncbi:MAG: Vitamin B12-binding protein [Candidatus Argoarchaeum ethanivorans]|uniref:Vitamin B12-binding protein n=1 Tax=Candidatus Argoarchaeum ethanivorans TaxID=2608793 RepID=A0A811T339_9EURY|nr:MAG: Vitamin B12-binding protein [Candidatus Argoarchaeum ethanivorans]